ncbi:type IV secretion protein Rhs [Kitasatospora sp. MMS16-BH015]|uniref:RHS repeat-associated core domain-containing protein n=1 Tax=Kitasatospora sp. MMS16-BH015 TaxID=2018025 RepID=UPI000CA3BBFE|nr:RHS repeat-associated core domain-containing protein [Kitasatospora sp. MMS16-BH015]AUG75818.1 type IV secretion protein Rhs [Kitasatospora sp. MMS16-BH015]
MPPAPSALSRARRGISLLLPLALGLGLVQGLAGPARADSPGPSVPVQSTASVPVTQQGMSPRIPDQATLRSLHGDQPAPAGPGQPGGGSAQATPLAPTASWDVVQQTGDFTWSYPLRVPPAPGGLQPSLALSYSSGRLDGRTSATNNQPSWVGDGWDLSAGYVQRDYSPCADTADAADPAGHKTGDLCWQSENAAVSFPGGSGPLVKDPSTGWHAKPDNGARVEHVAEPAGADYWRITTVDGTQYLFGSRTDSTATWSVPVFGRNSGEPCHGATWDSSWCSQPWRWNLDAVIDRHGNTMLYTYTAETGSYGLNLKDAPVGYTRGGTLARIDYGLHDGLDGGRPAGRVLFTTADRCVPGSTCTSDHRDNWPDVPWDSLCDPAGCRQHHSPTFWSSKRLDKVTTQVLRGSGYADVDTWSLDQQYPDPGDGGKAALWLKGITHTGLSGGSPATLPEVAFEGTQLPNRVWSPDGYAPLNRYRVTAVVSEAGGVTSISYAPPDCTADQLPAPESNTRRCFPVRWSAPGSPARTDFFHKYVVDSVSTADRIATGAEQVTRYEYLDGAAWHFDTGGSGRPDTKTWNEFRGFGRVRVHVGTAGDPSGPVGLTEYRFYRGMNGDHLPSGVRKVDVTDSEGGARTDEDWLTGQPVEQATYNGESGPVVTKTLSWPTVQGPTATRDTLSAYLVRTGTTKSYTALSGGGTRITETDTVYDGHGLPVQVDDHGDLADHSQARCTRTAYAVNTAAWLLDRPARVETVATDCSSTPVYPDQAVSDTRTWYDGQTFGAAPSAGDATTTEVLARHPAAGPDYVVSGTAGYDGYGRTVRSADALGRATSTAYAPAGGGPATGTTVTDPAGFATVTTLDPAFGQPLTVTDPNGRVTETSYDGLGRATELWLPNRSRAAGQSGNARFGYLTANDRPSSVRTDALGPNGTYVTSTTVYDGLYRKRQTQAPAPGGGRLLVDTRYDSHGRVFRETQPYANDGAVDTALWSAADTAIPMLTQTAYDGAGRPTATVVLGGGTEKWRTTTGYEGDRTSVLPPDGGVAGTTLYDARGRTTELRQYRSHAIGGDYDATTYRYTPAGRLAGLTDPAGNTWSYDYDLMGRQIRSADPDKGTTTLAYDAAGQLLSTVDARGSTLSYSYDALGRTTAEYAGPVGGSKLADWSYDTVPNGKGRAASATRYQDGNPYTTKILGYNKSYQVIKSEVDIPAAEGALAGSYVAQARYNPDGSLAGEVYPGAGDLFEETVSHTYDDLGHPLLTFGGPTGSTIDYVTDTQYTRYGEQSRLQLGDTGHRAWVTDFYDDTTRRPVRSVVDAEVAHPMQADSRYTYDPVGTITSISDTPLGQSADTQCFGHDHLQRLTDAWTPGNGDCSGAPSAASLGGPAPYWQSYGYDRTGNRLTDTRHTLAGDTTRTFSYPAAGAPQPHALTSVTPSGAAYRYDQAGNTVTRPDPAGGPAQQLAWDAEGRLATITAGTARTGYVYGADGSRLISHDPAGSTLYLPGEELRLDRTSGAVTGTRSYRHGGAVVAVRTGAGATWLASDHQGTAMIAVNPATMTVVRRRQDPFGVVRGDGDAAFPATTGFVGGTVDPSSGLIHLGAREYDAAAGRFLSVDPLLDPTDPQQLNAYAYSGNDPVTRSDPSGEWWKWLTNTVTAIGDAGKAAGNWIQDHKSAVSAVLGVAALAIAVCASAPAVLFVGAVLGVGSMILTAEDMVDSAKHHNNAGFVLDAISLGASVLAPGMGAVVKGVSAVSRVVSGAKVAEDALDRVSTAAGVAGGVPGPNCDSVKYPSGNCPDHVAPEFVPTGYTLLCGADGADYLRAPDRTIAKVSPELMRDVRGSKPADSRTVYERPQQDPVPPPVSHPYTTGDGRLCNRGGGLCAV